MSKVMTKLEELKATRDAAWAAYEAARDAAWAAYETARDAAIDAADAELKKTQEEKQNE